MKNILARGGIEFLAVFLGIPLLLLWVDYETKFIEHIDKYIFKIENKEFILNTNKLYIRENQIAVLKNVGISKINIEDIYDIDEKNDVIVHLYLH